MLPGSVFDNTSANLGLSQDDAPDTYFHAAHFQTAERPAVTTGLPTPPSSSRASIPPTPNEYSIAGRKRSRGEIHDDEPLSDIAHSSSSVSSARGDPVYGPGMTIVYPNDPAGHYATDASTQSGTWIEEQQDHAAAAAAAAEASRPIMPTRKSQRMSSSVATSNNISTEMLSPLSERSSGSDTIIDEASRMLGISWTRMDRTESTQISQRAYTRWIHRHYPQLTNVEVWFENSAIPGYLGKATNAASGLVEYYLWSYDLHQAILVTRNPADLVIKLAQPHMALSQATDKIFADVSSVVEASAANAAIVHNDRFLSDENGSVPAAAVKMDLD